MSAWLPAVDWQRHRLVFPLKLDADTTLHALNATAAQTGRNVIVLETTATASGIQHHLLTDAKRSGFISSTLRTALPGLRIEQAKLDATEFSTAVEFTLNTNDRPLRSSSASTTSTALLSAMQGLYRDESIRLQWMLRRAPGVKPVSKGSDGLSSSTGSGVGVVKELLWGPSDGPADAAKEASAKRSQPVLQVVGRLAVRAAHRDRSRQLLGRVVGALGTAHRPGVRLRIRPVSKSAAARRVTERRLPWGRWPLLLNTAEISGLLAWPVEVGPMPGLIRGQARTLPVPASIPRQGRILADSNEPGSKRAIALSATDRLQHMHVIGPTGSGKSYLLANIILQDIAAGDAVVVIDPKGDLVEDVLARIEGINQGNGDADSTDKITDRIIVLDPSDDQQPIGINLLDSNQDTQELLVESVVSVFHELYRQFWGPRTDDILRAALATLLATKQPYTICEIAPLLSEPHFRRHVLKQVGHSDPVLASFWSWFSSISEGERSHATAPLLNKLRAFTLRPRLRHMVGQTNGLRLSDVLQQRKVLLVTLNSGLIGRDAAQLLGSLVVAQLWQASLQRAAVPQDQRRPAMVTIDEAQDFLKLNVELGEMLTQARGLGVGLTLAHQHLGQLPKELQAGLTNARSKVIFALSRNDAVAMASEVQPLLSAQDLQGLQQYEVALRLAVGGHVQAPTTGLTRDLPPGVEGQAEQLRAASRQRYGTPVQEVVAELEQRLEVGRAKPAGRQQATEVET